MDELEAHNVKFPKQLWADAKEIADTRYQKMTDVLRQGLVRYVEEHGTVVQPAPVFLKWEGTTYPEHENWRDPSYTIEDES